MKRRIARRVAAVAMVVAATLGLGAAPALGAVPSQGVTTPTCEFTATISLDANRHVVGVGAVTCTAPVPYIDVSVTISRSGFQGGPYSSTDYKYGRNVRQILVSSGSSPVTCGRPGRRWKVTVWVMLVRAPNSNGSELSKTATLICPR